VGRYVVFAKIPRSACPNFVRYPVVTGASDGIGREFALQLATAGFNVFLAARNPEKLQAVVREIRTRGTCAPSEQANDVSAQSKLPTARLRQSATP
jgi:short-subunit dehydrogenase